MRGYAPSACIFAAGPATAASESSLSAVIRISSATSYSQRRAIVCAHSSRCSSTSGAQRYSSGLRSNASASGSSERGEETAAAGPISFCAIEEKATSSSSIGAIPVHSESRQPRTSSSSASPSSACSLTRLLQAGLDRVAVDAAVLEVELVGPVLDVADRVARDEPERDRLTAPAGLLARPPLREVRIGGHDRPRELERLAAALLAKDLPDGVLAHAARTASRTHCSWSRKRRRNASRSSVFGPWPVTTCFSSSQSASVNSHSPSSRLRSCGSGISRPSSRICGT